MHGYITRSIEELVRTKLQHNPAVAILGPRQCGKSTLAQELIRSNQHALYLDLECPSHLNMLQDKVSTSPQLNKGWWNALEALDIHEAWVIAPVRESYPVKKGIVVCSPADFIAHFS